MPLHAAACTLHYLVFYILLYLTPYYLLLYRLIYGFTSCSLVEEISSFNLSLAKRAWHENKVSRLGDCVW